MEQTQVGKDTWTVLSLLQWTTQYLTDNDIDSPRLTAELLLAFVLRYERIQLYTHYDQPLHPDELSRFKILLKRRLGHEPLQYIIGNTEFMGLQFMVDSHVLIPRPETEILVEHCLHIMRADPAKKFRVLDIGTGSGNIAVSLAKYNSNIHIDAIDVSKEALQVAAGNADRNKVSGQISFYEKDILGPKVRLPVDRYDLIVSNPPYISQSEFDQLQPEVRLFEPQLATTDNADGLSFYRAIALVGTFALAPDGAVVVEMAYNQHEAVREIFLGKGYTRVEVIPDYSGIQRVLIAWKT